MKVLLVSGEYPPMRGGVADYTAILARSLGYCGCQVSVLTSKRASVSSGDRPTSDSPFVTVYPNVVDWSPIQVLAQVNQILRERRPDVVQIEYQTGAYGMRIGVNLLPWLLHAQTDRPRLVVTFHDLKEPYLLPKIGRARHLATFALATGVDAVVVTNHEDFHRVASVADPMRCRPILGQRTLAAIPIGSNIVRPPADYDRAIWRARLGASADDFVIGFFGFLVPSKGVEILIAAFEQLLSRHRSLRLAMIGASAGDTDIGGDAYAAQVSRRLAGPPLDDRVSWTGFVPEDEVAAYLRACDVVCLPFREGASLRHGTLAAAIAQGLPIITTRSQINSSKSRLPELHDGENALLVAPGNSCQVADALARLIDDAPLRKRLASNVTQLASQLDWRRIAEQHVALYDRLVAK